MIVIFWIIVGAIFGLAYVLPTWAVVGIGAAVCLWLEWLRKRG